MFTQIGKSLKYTARNEKEVHEIYKTKLREEILIKRSFKKLFSLSVQNKLKSIKDCSHKLVNF